MDSNFMQKRMIELQNDASFQSAFGKLVSGKTGYKPVIEKNTQLRCKKCNTLLDSSQKFCHECGTKVEKN
jgi:rRNA maturation endonuclease Nob1